MYISGKRPGGRYWDSFFNNTFSEAMKKEGPRRKPQPNVNFDDENLNSFDGLESLNSGTGVEIINWDNFDAWLTPAPPPRLSWHH